jgi:hypothetical protein
MSTFYCLRFETLPNWRARSPYLYPPGTEWPDYILRHWVPFSSSPTTHRAMVATSFSMRSVSYQRTVSEQFFPEGRERNMTKSHAGLETENDYTGEGQQQFPPIGRPGTITLVCCLTYSSTLNMEETCSSETSFDFQRTTLHYIPGDRILHQNLCKNLRSYML